MKVNKAQIKQILRLLRDGKTYEELALQYGKDVNCIQNIDRKNILVS